MEYYLLEGTYAMNGVINELIRAENIEEAIEIAEIEYPINDGYRWKVKEAINRFLPK